MGEAFQRVTLRPEDPDWLCIDFEAAAGEIHELGCDAEDCPKTWPTRAQARYELPQLLDENERYDERFESLLLADLEREARRILEFSDCPGMRRC
ncbi:MAG TPA: hypothetical protein VGK58_01990 [Lacipirellulaceae bacterium]